MVNKPMTNQEVLQWASCFLENVPSDEATVMVRQLMMHLTGWTWSELLLHLREESSVTLGELTPLLARLNTHEPLQYVTGHCEFYGRDFAVTPATLIPRPETEELVALCADFLREQPRGEVLEIGVGSGCVITTLALEAPQHQYTGVDISQEALAVARVNAERLGVSDIALMVSDVYRQVPEQQYLAIVSNPPYISEAEKSVMDASVLTYEPETALFAAEDGLAIYRRIAEQLEAYLLPEGRAYFEIGYRQGAAVQALMATACPERNVRVVKDMAGLDRMVIVGNRR